MARITYPSYGQTTLPAWIGDFTGRDHVVPGGAKIDAAAITAQSSVVVTLSAAAAVAATSLTVAALSGPIPSGYTLYFGPGKFAVTTAAVAATATAIPVTALFAALASGDVATFPGTAGKLFVPSGMAVGRT